MDAKKRDAQVIVEGVKKGSAVRQVGPGGISVKMARLVRATDETHLPALVARFGDDAALAKALVEGDPEIPLAWVGRPLQEASRVQVDPDGQILQVARFLEVVRGPNGDEKARRPYVDVEATVTEDGPPLLWTGRLVPKGDIVRRIAFSRALQLRHVSGLTFEFLYEMAKTLHDADKLLMVGAGEKGQKPLILQLNGLPWRGFLEGRVEGEGYKLVLHLSNLELKTPTVEPAP